MAAAVLFVGLGSHHGDDRLGWRVAEDCQSKRLSGVIVRQAATPADVLDWLEGINRLVVCDACSPNGNAGGIHRWTWPTGALRRLRCQGSHDFSLPAVLELAAALDQLPKEVVIFAVEGRRFEPNEDLSPEIEQAVRHVAHQIELELKIMLKNNAPSAASAKP